MKKIKVIKPWGYFQILESKKDYKIKKIYVKPFEKLSLQRHNSRSENWVIVKGKAKITLGNKIYNLNQGKFIFVPKLKKHRIENNSKKELIVLELQLGSYLGEDDIIRYKDKYKRKVSK